MDLFDRRILAVLKDGKPRGFQQVLSEVDFSHNTLRLHLASLERQGMILKAKTLKSSPGRPSFTYSSPPRPNKELLWRSQSRTRPLLA